MDDLTPVTRTERLLDGEDLTPTNREEMFIKRIYDKTQEIPEPVNRKEYFLKKAGEAGGDVTVEQLSVTANGTYSEEGKAYSPVTVEVQPPENSYQLKSITTPTSLATFNASAMPMPTLKVSVEAKQAGSGTPSPENVRPISGWDAVVVSDNDGGNLYGGTFNTLFPLFIPKQTRITASALGQTTLALYDAQKNKIDDWGLYDVDEATGRNYRSLVFNYDVYYVSFIYREASDVQIKKGLDITYSAYNGNTTTISLPQTVYGGELDVVNGVLRITDGYIASYNGETLPSTWISSMDVYAEGTTPTTGAEVCYELATPTTVSITPTPIKSLNGTNNLSVDCGEILEGTYFKALGGE